MSLKFIIDPAPATSPHRPHVRAGVARTFNVPGVTFDRAARRAA